MDFNKEFNKATVLDFLKNQFLPDDFTVGTEQVNFSQGLIKEIEYIGESKNLDLKLFVVRHDSENDPRVTLSRETFRVMSNLGARRALVVFHSSASPNWRLSLATITLAHKNTKIKREYSNPRRYSFFLGPAAKTHTPEQFLTRKGRVQNVEDLKERFSVEVVTKEFFKELSNWYFWVVKSSTFPKDVENENNGKNIAAIRMVTRLVFIWFMKQKELVPGYLFGEKDVKEILLDLSPDGDSYYKAILQNLFFATLNTPTAQRKFRAQIESQNKNKDFMEHSYYRYERYFKDPKRILSLFKDIPFLNGGLFDCLDEWLDEAGENRYIRIDGFSDRADNLLHVPNCLFFSPEQCVDLNKEYGTKNVKYTVRGLINILESYNFTIDENTPVDEEIALDPELLGRVFENLLASYNPETATTARKATGSYYTPREIVSYMVEESLKQFLKTALGPAQDLDEKLNSLLSYNTDINPFNDHDSSKLITALNSLKIIDPAVGSGAFPMGILQRLVLVLSKLDPHNEKWERQQIDAVEKNVSDIAMKRILIAEIERNFSKNELDYGRKLYLIQNCIYGVDIQPIAIQIAKLRFFISLLVDEKLDAEEKDKGIKPLPNLDFKLVCANSLIGLPEMHKPSSDNSILAALESEKQELGKEYVQKLNSGKLDIFEKKQIVDRLKSIDKKIAATRQTGCDESDVHSLFSSSDTMSGLRDVRAKYFAATNKTEKNKLKNKFFKIQEQIRAEVGWSVQDAAQTKLFGYEGIKLKTETKGTEKAAKLGAWDPFSNKSCEWFDPEWMFGAKGGFDIIIANPPYVSHDKIMSKTEIQKNYQSFEAFADLYCYFLELGVRLLAPAGNMCYITSNSYLRADYGFPLRRLIQRDYFLKTIINLEDTQIFDAAIVNTAIINVQKKSQKAMPKCLILNTSYKQKEDFNNFIEHNKFYYEQNDFSDKSWTLNPPNINKIKKKIENAGKSLEAVNTKIRLGLATGANEAFIIDENIKKELLKKDSKNSDIIKPILRGRDILRYAYNLPNLYILLTKNGINIKGDYPLIYKHLESFGPDFKNRGAQGQHWTNLRACAFFDDFKKEKIVWIELTDRGRFALCTEEIYLLNSAYFLIPPQSLSAKYLLAILNSKIIYFYLTLVAETSGMGTLRWINNYVKDFPIVELSQANQRPFINIVDEILVLKSKKPEADTSELEVQIDQLVYKLYNLTPEEIKIVETATK